MGSKKLDPKQQAKLDYLHRADLAWRDAKLHARRRAQEEAEKQIEAFATDRALAAYEAFVAGIPKSVIGREGLSTTAPSTVGEAIDRGLALSGFNGVERAQKPGSNFTIGTVMAWNGTQGLFWVLDSNHPEVETTFATFTHPGYAVMLKEYQPHDSVTLEGAQQNFRSTADGLALEVLEWAREHEVDIDLKEPEGI